MLRRGIILILSFVFLFPLFASAEDAFTQAKFDGLNKEGKPVLVEVYADWCRTCKEQERVLHKLLPQPEFNGIMVLRVNFDTQKAVVKAFDAHFQSTLIVYKNGKEAGRVTGETDINRIAELLRNAL